MSERRRQPRQGEATRSGADREEPAGSARLPRGSAARPVRRPEPFRYTMKDLEADTGLSARTIRYYITEGLLPPAYGRGPGAIYDAGHLMRLQAIVRLKDQHLPLDDIRKKLGNLSEGDISALLRIETAAPGDLWRRIPLHPDLELLVRERPGGVGLQQLLDVVETIRLVVRDELDNGDGEVNR